MAEDELVLTVPSPSPAPGTLGTASGRGQPVWDSFYGSMKTPKTSKERVVS